MFFILIDRGLPELNRPDTLCPYTTISRSVLLADANTREAGEAVIDLTSASGDRRFLRIALINDDMPFLVDSVAAAIAEAGLVIDRLVHPVMPVRRNAKGQLEALPDEGGKGTVRESMIYIETARVDARQRRELLRVHDATRAEVRSAVRDWPRMLEVLSAEDRKSTRLNSSH